MNRKEFDSLLTKQHIRQAVSSASRVNRALGEDAAQEGLMRAMQECHKVNIDNFDGWLTRVVVNTAKNFSLSNSRHWNRIEKYPGTTTTEETPESLCEASKTYSRVIDALSNAGAKNTEAFLLFYTKGVSMEGLTERIGGSSGTNKSRVSRARSAVMSAIGG